MQPCAGYWEVKVRLVTRSTVVALFLLLLCSGGATAAQPVFHRCSISIKRVTPDELSLELWSTSQVTSYSADVNYGFAPCCPWNGHEKNWMVREELQPGLYTLPWVELYGENPSLGMEACINYTCQPEVTVIYWSQDYRTVLGYLFLPFTRRL